MKNNKPNAAQVWKQMEDLLAPLNFSVIDRAVYSHLLRHSRLEGKLRFQFSISWLARGVGLSAKCTRDTVRRLIARGVLHLVERNYRARHVVRVRLPLEIRGVRAAKIGAHRPRPRVVINIEEADFLGKRILSLALHERERGHCFYCLRRITAKRRCLDHVVPRGVRAEFLPQPRFLLRGLQLAKRRVARRRISAQALPRTALERQRDEPATARTG